MAARYSKVERRVWRDEKFRKLSADGRLLWLYLLTCDAHGGFPGLFLLRLSTAAEDLDWDVAKVREELGCIEAAGMLQRDEATSVVWLPRAVAKHAEKLSPANAKGWRNAWEELPDGLVTRAAFTAAVAALRSYEDSAKAPELVRVFVGRAPEWWGARGPQEAPKSPPAGGHEAPSNPPRGPVELGQGQGEGQGEEGAPQEAPTSTPPLAELSPEVAEVVEELQVGRDLYRPAYVSDQALADSAARILRAIRFEPKAKGHDRAAIVRDAVTGARRAKSKRPAMTDEEAFATVEDNATRWILGDIRIGKRIVAASSSAASDRRSFDQIRREDQRAAQIASLPDDDDPLCFDAKRQGAA